MLAKILAESKVYGAYTPVETKLLTELCNELHWSAPVKSEVIIGDYGLQLKISLSNNTFIVKGIDKSIPSPKVGEVIPVEHIMCVLYQKGQETTIKVKW